VAAKNRSKKKVDIALSGALKSQGHIKGKGTLTLSLADATQANLTIDTKQGRTKVTLTSAVGLKIRKSATLDLSTKLSKDLHGGPLAGKVAMELKLPKDVGLSIEHQIKPGDDVTSVKITMRF
jgi:hypothetical protein